MSDSTQKAETGNLVAGHDRRRRRIVALAFVLLLGAGCYMLFRVVDPNELRLSLEKVSISLAASLIALNVICVLLVGCRTGVLVSAVAPGISSTAMAYINLVALISSYASVGKMNAPVKAMLLKKMHGAPLSRVTPALVAEAAFDLAAVVFLSLVGIILAGPLAVTLLEKLGWKTGHVVEHVLIVGVAGACVAGIGWLLKRRVGFVASMVGAVRQLASDRRRLLQAAGLSALIHGVNLLAVTAVLHFLDLRMDFVLLLTALPIIAGLFTPMPGGIGVREFVFGAVYGLCCGGAPLAIIAALLLRLAFFASLPFAFLIVKAVEMATMAKAKGIQKGKR